MPYADPGEQRAAQARWYAKRYADAAFKKKEADRKADWLKTDAGRASNAEASRRDRLKPDALEASRPRSAAKDRRDPARRK